MSFIEDQAQAHNERVARSAMQSMDDLIAWQKMTPEQKSARIEDHHKAVIAMSSDGMMTICFKPPPAIWEGYEKCKCGRKECQSFMRTTKNGTRIAVVPEGDKFAVLEVNGTRFDMVPSPKEDAEKRAESWAADQGGWA